MANSKFNIIYSQNEKGDKQENIESANFKLKPLKMYLILNLNSKINISKRA